jgi:hypothetical protein
VNADKKAREHGTKVERGFGDGAFDSNECYKIALELGITPVIKPRNMKPSARTKNPRKRFVKEYFELEYDQWRDKYR